MKIFLLILAFTAFIASSSTRTLIPKFQDKIKLNGRIIGGEEAHAGQFPCSAAIYITTGTGTYFCGGAVISPDWVITAAHCTEGGTNFQINLGSNILQGSDPNRLTVSATTYYNHPEFDPDTLENDVGLIKFHISISFNDYIHAIHLPTEDQNDNIKNIAVGWGTVSDDSSSLSNVLNFVEVTVISNEECQLSFANPIFDTMVCVAGNYNEGACRGDSGTPLMIMEGHHHLLVGVSSFISTNGCETTDPSGYTRISSYVDWIKNTTGIE